MPSSIEHCDPCEFAAIPAGDAVTVFEEEGFVRGHILALAGVGGAVPIDFARTNVTRERDAAASSCAQMIRDGRCERFAGLVVHPVVGGVAQVFFVDKIDPAEE